MNESCNPCYNGSNIHFKILILPYQRVVILVIMEVTYSDIRLEEIAEMVVILVIMEDLLELSVTILHLLCNPCYNGRLIQCTSGRC